MAELLQITRGCEYAVKAMAWIARQPEGTIVQADQIASGAGLPGAFAGNILTRLAKHGLLTAHRGASRGYRLVRPAHQVTLLEIIEAYDGAFEKPFCFMNRDRACNPNDPCALHAIWQEVRASTKNVLQGMTLENLANNPASLPKRSRKKKGADSTADPQTDYDLRFRSVLGRGTAIQL